MQSGGIRRRLSLRLSKLFDTGTDSEVLVARLHWRGIRRHTSRELIPGA
ncbi:hypothetical protein SM0020_25531 [Sinorhizobium meliloti CCNWSX0020]|uniref:Uncharacterized protein n=1 Tax=Sinorhizobium meliloti CCNWSX0020 TaxID=1107881 RepID=H0G6I4_RHIML|nr:hypothetical protein SM0020_25531 [Sinorhizobium meliloti CCNWSX0020]